MHKKFMFFISILIVSTVSIVGFSPFKVYEGDKWPSLIVSTTINATPCQVYEYLGNSDNAREWSSFVDHITLIKGSDGQIGSLRRCFKDRAEKKEQWDETTVLDEPCKKRRLTVFNLKNFPIKGEGLLTEQIYEYAKGGKCKLSFKLFYKKDQNYFWPLLKMHIFSYYIENIFQKNVDEIKRLNQNPSL